MAEDLQKKLAGLPERLLVEVALNVLSDNDIDDLSQAPAIVAQRAGIPVAELQRHAERAAKDMAGIGEMARLVLSDVASTPEGAQAVAEAIDDAGTKQFVLGGAELILVSILISGALSAYVAVQTGGKKSEKSKTSLKLDAKGNIVGIVQESVVTYPDPLTGMAGLLKQLLAGKLAGTGT